MRLIFPILAAGLLWSGAAHAQCYGPPGFLTCEDEYGNRFEVSRFGGQEIVYGRDGWTGERWRRESYRIGDTVLSRGRTPWGETWRSQEGPGGTFYSDADGTVAIAPRRP